MTKKLGKNIIITCFLIMNIIIITMQILNFYLIIIPHWIYIIYYILSILGIMNIYHSDTKTIKIIGMLLFPLTMCFVNGNIILIIPNIICSIILAFKVIDKTKIIFILFLLICSCISVSTIYLNNKTFSTIPKLSSNNQYQLVLYMTEIGPGYRGRLYLEDKSSVLIKKYLIQKGKANQFEWIDPITFTVDGKIYKINEFKNNLNIN